MLLQSNLTPTTVYRKEYLYTVDTTDTTLNPFQIIFKALSIKDIDFIRNLTQTATNQINLIILQKSIIEFINIFDNLGNEVKNADISILNIEQIKDIAKVIWDLSTVSEETYKVMKLSATIALDKSFQTDTWTCEYCKYKGLDRSRNCKFRKDFKDNYDNTFFVMVNGEKFKECPIYYKNDKYISDMFLSFNSFEKGILPEVGGLADQSEFFIYAVKIIQALQSKKLEESKEE